MLDENIQRGRYYIWLECGAILQNKKCTILKSELRNTYILRTCKFHSTMFVL